MVDWQSRVPDTQLSMLPRLQRITDAESGLLPLSGMQLPSASGDWWRALAPAKINLFLHITGQRDNGYHDLQTLFQFLDWHDELAYRVRDDGELRLQTSNAELQSDDNLVIRAARALQQVAGGSKTGCDIALGKMLPMGAGLGGGSSDAATTLCALNQLWELNLSSEQLIELGLSLGADVPVFVAGHACWAEGIGEKMSVVELPEYWYLLASPDVHVETAKVFNSPQLTRDTSAIKIADFLAGDSRNDCENVVTEQHASIGHLRQLMQQALAASSAELDMHGDLPWQALPVPRMTGTGSTLFAVCHDQVQAQLAANRLQENKAIQARFTVAKAMNVSGLFAEP